ncbi:helix-turn-helix transcriptional regulator [Streptomyces sp. M2CJ-2]|uniref:winged helix-turn-helix transcriptional regulator n=1 Tax=Streptomyces sp. M2CJ-2 TaxID=2803948 RepID=UPI001926A1BD|nr:helix-turn-helix domain-containing protein [Streptomyces sp. M2CJ-2]MBL3668344.1 helix-turn-helix transcriptional regulator [Streptomyces sp. M2CJ-2]
MTWLETSTENCTVQRTLDLVGEKWSLLLVRDAMNGVRRFDDFRRHVGLSESVLTDRLRKLVAAGIMRTVPYSEPGSRTRHEYRLTRKGWDLWPAMMALKQWGDRYTADPEGPPLEVAHRECGRPVEAVVVCTAGHGALIPPEALTRPGPSAHPATAPAR